MRKGVVCERLGHLHYHFYHQDTGAYCTYLYWSKRQAYRLFVQDYLT